MSAVDPSRVTARQRLVLREIASGATQPEAARVLRVSRDVIANELRYARRALGARNAVHAVAIALRLGLIRAVDVRLPEAPGSAPPLTPEATEAAVRP